MFVFVQVPTARLNLPLVQGTGYHWKTVWLVVWLLVCLIGWLVGRQMSKSPHKAIPTPLFPPLVSPTYIHHSILGYPKTLIIVIGTALFVSPCILQPGVLSPYQFHKALSSTPLRRSPLCQRFVVLDSSILSAGEDLKIATLHPASRTMINFPYAVMLRSRL